MSVLNGGAVASRVALSNLMGAAGRSTCQVAGAGIIAGRFAAGCGRARCRVINGLLRRSIKFNWRGGRGQAGVGPGYS